MDFASIFDQNVNSSETRDNILADGQFTCTYPEIPAFLIEIEAFLVANSIGADTCLSVECPNSLAGALLLIALMKSGRSFVLVPPPAVTASLKPTPNYCRFRLTVTSSPSPAFDVASFFHLEANPGFNGASAEPGRMYLRTSGSMGASKIVVHSHEKLLGNAWNVVRKYRFSPASRAVVPVPIAHMYGFGAEFLPAILAGASIDLQEKTNVLKYLGREKQFQPNIAFVTPNICEMLLKGFKSVRNNYDVVVTSGQRISEELFRAFDPFVGGKLINQYGSSEMGAIAACDPGESLDRRAATIGRAMDGVQLRIDPPGRGDLYCHHPFGFEGYLNEDGEWIQRAPSGNWYRTGDLAATQADGSIVVVGRADASVNRSGYLVLLADIERQLEKLESFGEVVVVAGSGESKHGQRIAAFCVPRGQDAVSPGDLRQRCFDVLPHYAIPDEVHVREALPLLPSGKVDRQTLAALVGSF